METHHQGDLTYINIITGTIRALTQPFQNNRFQTLHRSICLSASLKEAGV